VPLRGSREITGDGNSQNQVHDFGAAGNFTASASGNCTPGCPAARSASNSARAFASCARSPSRAEAGSRVKGAVA